MNDNDTSDEAFQAWTRETFDIYSKLACWREAVRRREAQMEEFRKEANETYRQNEIKWMDIVSNLRKELEERERKAFEEGFYYYQDNVDYTEPCKIRVEKGYRAFKEAQK